MRARTEPTSSSKTARNPLKCPNCEQPITGVLAERLEVGNPAETAAGTVAQTFSREIESVVAVACPHCRMVIGITR